uniref:Endoplasmic reticulum-Golgi intermediate compartment protein 3 n=1 Tax=Pristionchus pacificus TaxID=54126 RepID=A0A2A6BET3_PRIPA|eukprot:PDM64410.1 erv-46 [Pristionchus pacificus]
MSLKQITLKEVSEHNSMKSLWFVIGNKVYDVTKFVDEHPGGCEVLLEQAGKDATEAFEDVGHSTDARAMKEEYIVGEIVEEERKLYSYDKKPQQKWNTDKDKDNKVRNFDAYSKPLEDFRIKTASGGLVTVIAAIVIIGLSISETVSYLQLEIVEQLFVDSTTSDERVPINFDIRFHRLPCTLVTIDVMDVSSDNQVDIEHDIFKVRLDKDGRNITEVPLKLVVNQNATTASTGEVTTPKCGSCYGALPDGSCCNTCDEVKEAYQLKGWQVNLESVEQCKNDEWLRLLRDHKEEGCRVYGRVNVSKVAGNFHIAPGDPFRTLRAHVHDLHSLDASSFDCAHSIDHLSFGTHWPDKDYPLDGSSHDEKKGGVMYQYYVKVVPTSYHSIDSHTTHSHQFSVTTHRKVVGGGVSGLPGLFVQYEFSPLMVLYEERQAPLSAFLVNLCAIIGGVFTVASLIDSFIYSGHRVIAQKMNLNKLG